MSSKHLKILLILELFSVLVIVLVLFLGRSTDQSLDDGVGSLVPLGGIEAKTVEGIVSSADSDSICVCEDGEIIELYCANPSAKSELGKVKVGDIVYVTYFDSSDSEPYRYHAYSIEKRYAEPPIKGSL